MRNILGKTVEMLVLLLVIYPFGIFLGIFFQLFQRRKIIRILHWERFPHFNEKVILVTNHPSMLDPFLMSALFFREYLSNPFRYAPLIVADRKNFYDSWRGFWLRLILIPIERGNKGAETGSLLQMEKLIKNGRIIIIFLEGGRTFLGERFLYSEKGKRIRKPLKAGVGYLATKTNALVVPVWIDGSDKMLPNSPNRKKLFTHFILSEPVTIKIGKPMRFQKTQTKGRKARAEKITQIIADALLELADE